MISPHTNFPQYSQQPQVSLGSTIPKQPSHNQINQTQQNVIQSDNVKGDILQETLSPLDPSQTNSSLQSQMQNHSQKQSLNQIEDIKPVFTQSQLNGQPTSNGQGGSVSDQAVAKSPLSDQSTTLMPSPVATTEKKEMDLNKVSPQRPGGPSLLSGQSEVQPVQTTSKRSSSIENCTAKTSHHNDVKTFLDNQLKCQQVSFKFISSLYTFFLNTYV